MEPVDVSGVDVYNMCCLVTSFLYVIVDHQTCKLSQPLSHYFGDKAKKKKLVREKKAIDEAKQILKRSLKPD